MTKQAGSKTRLYHCWYNMNRRCNNPQAKDYFRYGGRGIKVLFKTFDEYRKWFQETFKVDDVPSGYQIDRTNNDGNYEPSNLRLSTYKEQQNNRSTNKWIEWKGEKHTISQWSDIVGIPRKTLEKRLGKHQWSPEKSFTTPVANLLEHNGEFRTAADWARVYQITYSTVLYRLNKGMTISQALQ